MRTKYLFLGCLFFTFVLFLSSAPAQNYTKWGLPEGATARIGKGPITSNIAYSPDGSRLAVSSSIGIWIYDAHTGKELDLLVEDIGSITSIAYSPNGKTLAAANLTDVHLWDANTGKYKTRLLAATEANFFFINSIVYSPDGKTIATAGGTEAHLWDAVTGKHKTTVKDNQGGFKFNSLAYSPDGKTIATAGGTMAHLWNIVEVKHKTTLKGHTDDIYSVGYSPDGKTIATGGADGKVHLWDAVTGKHKTTLKGYTHQIYSIVYSPDGTTLAVASGNRVHLHNASTGKNKNMLEGHLYGRWGYVDSIAYSPDGKTIATASKGEVRFWDAETGRHTVTLKEHTLSLDFFTFTYSPDGKTIATAIADPLARHSHEGIVLLWDAITGVRKEAFDYDFVDTFDSLCFVKSLAYSPNGKTIAVVIGGKVYFSDAETGKRHESILKVGWETSVAYAPDGKTIATAIGHNVLFWDTDTRKLKNTINDWTGGGLPHTKSITFVVYSPDGKTIASASGNEVHVWDVDTEKHKSTLKGHTKSITFVAYSPDGKTIITASSTREREVRLWNVETGENTSTFVGYSSLVYSPDGKTVTTTKATGEVHLWDAHLEKHITIPGRGTPVYSPDGKTLATHYGGTILLLDTRILASQLSQQPPTSISNRQNPFRKVATPQTPQQIAKSALASTVLIVMEDRNGQPLNIGSGFFIARDTIATNLHVVEGVFKGYVKRIGIDKTYRIEGIVAMDSRQDLAIIRVSGVDAPVLSLGKSDKVQIGESIYVAGNPIGFLEGTFSNGIVSGVREFRVGSERIQITAPISKGSSGGPVLNSKGEVIGVAVSIITAGQNLNFAIPSNYLSELLHKAKGRK